MNAIKSWYANHFTKFLGFLVFALAGLDIAGYAEPIKLLIGDKGYAAAQLIIGVATIYRGWENSQKGSTSA